jgi:DNA-binding SARP family transcriptional activator
MNVVRVALLGPPAVSRDGVPVSFDTRKAIALLAFLAVTGREHSRDQLAGLLWPDVDPVRAHNSLRRTLSVTAAELRGGLAITRSTVGLAGGIVTSDFAEFEELSRNADAASLERAVWLYRADFLAGFTLRDCAEFEEWQTAEAERLRQLLARVLQRLVSACVEAGALDSALEHARRWLALDRLHEPAHQALIRLLGWTGQRSAALGQYRTLVRVLDHELAVRPLPATTQLYEAIRRDQLEPPPPPITTPPPSGSVSPAPAPSASAAATVSRGWPVVGRDGERAALTACWKSGGTPVRAVAVVGEAGSGKSTLVHELAAAATAAGATVLAGRCHDGEEELPYVLAADLLRACLSARPDLPAHLTADTATLAGRLVPAVAAAHNDVPRPPLDSPVAVARMYAAIADTIATALAPPPEPGARSDPRPQPAGLVLVEDAHWADGSSLDLLGYLVRRMAELPAVLVISWRAEQAGRLRGLRAAVAEQAGAGRATVLELPPLDTGELASLLVAVGRADADPGRLLAETRGLPLLVRAYIEALPPAGSGPDWWLTGSVRDLLRDRLAAVSEPTHQVLTAAAVLGGDCDADLLRSVSGRGEDEVVDAIDEATARLLLAEVVPAGGQAAPSYQFPYEALRRTVYDAGTLARRRLLHGRAADALARRHEREPMSAASAVIADHLQQAGRDEEAANWSWLAATRARELYAHSEAVAHLTRALALGYPEVPGRVALGEVLLVLGRYAEALGEFETAAAVADGDPMMLAIIEHKLAEVQHRLGNWDLAAAHLAAVEGLLPEESLSLRARAYADHAVVAFRRGDTRAAADLGAAALAAAEQAADGGATAQALNVLGMVAASDCRRADAERYLLASLAQARDLPAPGTAVAALNNLGRLLAEEGRADEALAAAQEALDLGSELGDQHRLAALHTNIADLLHAAGRQDEAVGHLKEAARRFAAVDAGEGPRPEIWTLVEW